MKKPDEDRVLDVLSAFFERRERGEVVDLVQLADGDEAVARRAQELLELEPPSFRDLASWASGSEAEEGQEAPERLGEYRLVSLLGRGGMGSVWLAEQDSLDRMVAVKVLDRAAFADDTTRLRFQREAEIAAALEHPNIVPIHAVGTHDGRGWIAMKWLRGPALDALDAPLAAREAAAHLAKVARALHAAHRQGIVHRDVKPGNIILDGDVPYIVDFGLARAEAGRTLTREGVVPGTLPYVAPESLREGAAAPDARSDIYALGATLYEVIAGKPAFGRQSTELLIRAILQREPVPLRLAGADRDLETIVMRALEKEPERRFATAEEMALELERYVEGRPVMSRRVGPVGRAVRAARRNPRTAGAAMIALLAVVGFLGYLVADRMAREAAFEGDLAEVRAAVERGELAYARALVATLGADHGGDDRFRRVARRVEGARALRDLLDLVQERRESIHPGRLRGLVERVRESGAVEFEPRNARLAMAVAALHRGDRDGAGALVAAVEQDRRARDTAAIRAVLRDDADWRPPAGAGRTPDEHLFAALALRLLDVPVEVRRREVDHARRLDPNSYRAQYGHAMMLVHELQYERALDAFTTLPRPGRKHAAVHRQVAWLLVLLERPDEARGHLDHIDAEQWAPMDAAVDLAVEWQARRHDEVDRRLAEYLVRWPKESALLYFAGQWHALNGRPDEAIDAYEAAWVAARGYGQGEMAHGDMLAMCMRQVTRAASFYVVPLNPEDEEEVESLTEEAAEMVESARRPFARSRALWVQAWGLRQLGRWDESWRALEEAVEAHEKSINPRLDHAWLTFEFVLRGEVEPRDDLTLKESQRIRRAAALAREIYTARRWPTPGVDDQVVRAERVAAFLCRWDDDRDGCRDAVARALARLQEPADDHERAWKERLLRLKAWAGDAN